MALNGIPGTHIFTSNLQPSLKPCNNSNVELRNGTPITLITKESRANRKKRLARERIRRWKERMTEEEMRLFRKADAERVARRRANETEEERARRRRMDRIRAAKRRANETEEERTKRKNADRVRIALRRSMETEEETKLRRKIEALRSAIRRAYETEEERRLRLSVGAHRTAERKANLSPEDRYRIRECDRIRKMMRRKNEKVRKRDEEDRLKMEALKIAGMRTKMNEEKRRRMKECSRLESAIKCLNGKRKGLKNRVNVLMDGIVAERCRKMEGECNSPMNFFERISTENVPVEELSAGNVEGIIIVTNFNNEECLAEPDAKELMLNHYNQIDMLKVDVDRVISEEVGEDEEEVIVSEADVVKVKMEPIYFEEVEERKDQSRLSKVEMVKVKVEPEETSEQDWNQISELSFASEPRADSENLMMFSDMLEIGPVKIEPMDNAEINEFLS